MSVFLDLNNLDEKIILNHQAIYPKLGQIAFKKLKELGIPNKKHEHWRYTDISEPIQLLEKSLSPNNQKSSKEKKNKDYKTADEIRIYLENHDILLEDNPNGTIWRKK